MRVIEEFQPQIFGGSLVARWGTAEPTFYNQMILNATSPSTNIQLFQLQSVNYKSHCANK